MNDDITAEAQAEIIKRHVRQLSEIFDAVQVFANTHINNEDGTRTFSYGSGNLYARIGHARDWLLKEEELSRQEIRTEDS